MSSDKIAVVVDDDPKVILLVEKALSDLGFRVMAADNGSKALELVSKERASLLITDILQPGLDGTQLCRAIQDNPETGDTRIIVMSGVYNESLYKLQMDCQAQGFLEKPIDIPRLKALVNKIFTGD